MRNLYFCCLFLLACTNLSLGQNAHEAKILRAGNTLAQAMVAGDYENIADYTYPRITEMMGGESQMVAAVKNLMQQMESQGIRISSLTLGTPGKLFEAGSELHCLVPQKMVMTTPEQTITSDSYLLAISLDQGGRWYFLDTAQLTNANAKTLLPDFNDNLKIPAKTPPQVEARQ